jgi:hypothetical protein
MNLKGPHMKTIDLKRFTIVSAPAKSLGNFLAALIFLLWFSVIPASANNGGCSNATLKGDYGFTISGYRPNPDGTTSPIKGVAITHFDGAGNFTQRDFVLTAGVPSSGGGNSVTGFQFSTGETGTYTINADCTGSAEIDLNVPVPFGSTGVIKLMLVVTNGGRAIHTVVSEFTPPGAAKPVLNTTSSDAWKVGSDRDQD